MALSILAVLSDRDPLAGCWEKLVPEGNSSPNLSDSIDFHLHPLQGRRLWQEVDSLVVNPIGKFGCPRAHNPKPRVSQEESGVRSGGRSQGRDWVGESRYLVPWNKESPHTRVA